MSNYNREPLKGFEETIIVGAEVANGTGQVEVQCYGDGGVVVYQLMTAEQALDFARLLADRAHEAMRARFVSDEILSG